MPEFAAKLECVRAFRPLQRIGQLPRHVLAPGGLRYANLIEAVDRDGRRSCREDARQPESETVGRPGVKVLVRVVKPLQEVVGSKLHLIQKVAAYNRVLDYGEVENVHRGGLEVLRIVRASHGRLRARGAEETHGERLFVVKVMIQLDDAVVAVVAVGRVGEPIVEHGPGVVGYRGVKRIVERQRKLVCCKTVGRQEILARCYPGVVQHGVRIRVAGRGKLHLAGEKQKRVILPDGSAQRKARLIIADRHFWGVHRGHRANRREKLVAVVVEDVAVDLVGPRFQHHVLVCARVAPHIGFGVALHGELVDRIDRHQTSGHAVDAALVGSDDTLPCINVVGAVDLEVDAGRALAVHRSAQVVSRSELEHLREVAAVDRHVLDLLVGDHRNQRAGCRVQGLNICVNLHHRVLPAHSQFHNLIGDFRYIDRDIVHLFSLKTGDRHDQVVGARRQLGKIELPGGV